MRDKSACSCAGKRCSVYVLHNGRKLLACVYWRWRGREGMTGRWGNVFFPFRIGQEREVPLLAKVLCQVLPNSYKKLTFFFHLLFKTNQLWFAPNFEAFLFLLFEFGEFHAPTHYPSLSYACFVWTMYGKVQPSSLYFFLLFLLGKRQELRLQVIFHRQIHWMGQFSNEEKRKNREKMEEIFSYPPFTQKKRWRSQIKKFLFPLLLVPTS